MKENRRARGVSSMTIKKRLVLSNVLMLLIPAILVLFIVTATIGIMMLFYHGEIGELGENQESVSLARDLVGHYLHGQEGSGSLDELSEMLDGLEFHLQVEHNGSVVQSNLSAEDNEAIGWLLEGFSDAQGALILAVDKVALVRDFTVLDGEMITLLAVNSSVENTGRLGGIFRSLIKRYFLFVFVAFLLIISLINAHLSSRVSKSVLTPLLLLGEGARRIQGGDLDFSLAYDGDDEFCKVFEDFDAMRQRLRESVQRQLRYEEDRRAFIAEMSHDIRTPLTAILGHVEGLRDGVAATPEKQKRYLDIIHRRVHEMDSLVDRLFLLSKLETGHFPFRFETVDLSEFLQQYLRSIDEEFSSKRQTIHFKNELDAPLLLSLDTEQLRAALNNLLENSLKYRARESGTCSIRLAAEQSHAVIEISDDGPGVAPAELPRLFESFYRGDKARSNPGDGSGLGLAIARRIIEAHGGTVFARNHAGLAITILLDRGNAYEKNSDLRR